MRLTTNRWKPDTCDCIIEFEFDADAEPEVRTHTGKNVVKACAEHTKDPAPVHYGKLLSENVGKNHTLKAIMDALPEEHVKLDEKGERVGFVKTPEFSFDANRKLKIKMDVTHPKGKALEDAVALVNPDVVIE